ncbi:Thiamine-phosphate synthase [Nitrospira japonica]|uniref:Thiamine-phosphate synthase n=1 Tax=Nitrospira japonica TaxID=1325564 RepID=A0A1W1I9N5_9BACT|nr:thiamine phosphate synthase [Nitrospira japonica]SLM49579.1 Thiamine-phosphate synthase [Nitrospira japonica]
MAVTTRTHELSGLYIILDPSVRPDRPLGAILKAAAEGGAKLFQYRNKVSSMREQYGEALSLRKFAAELGVTFIVNDRCDLALAVDADGVHLGQDDLSYGDVRKILGRNKIIGLSTHKAEQVREADDLKPDYIGFGPIFKPASKQDHDPVVGMDGLKQVRALTTLPVFAIGGIQAEEVPAVMRAGADGIAVISAAVAAPDVQKAVERLISLLA